MPSGKPCGLLLLKAAKITKGSICCFVFVICLSHTVMLTLHAEAMKTVHSSLTMQHCLQVLCGKWYNVSSWFFTEKYNSIRSLKMKIILKDRC